MDDDDGGAGNCSPIKTSATKRKMAETRESPDPKIKMSYIRSKRGLFKDHLVLYEDLTKREYPVLLVINSPTQTRIPMDLLKINKVLKNIQGVQYVKAAGNYFTKVYFASAKDANAFLSNKNVMNANNWSAKIPYDSIESQGIIRAPTELSEESLLENLKASCTILGVKRFTKKQEDGSEKPLQTVLVTFLSSSHPDHVTFEHIWMPVSEYIRPLLQCFKCYKFGHGSGACKSTQVCSICSAAHFYKECPSPTVFKCSNCSGPHSAVSYSCAVKAAKINEVKNKIAGMGKRYHCDYCDKTMVATPAIVKTHNKGIVHQKLVQEHYQQFKDPETILAVESQKKPCSRFVRGDCQFGSICRFSHYSPEQIEILKEIVATKNQKAKNQFQPSFEDLYLQLQTEKSSKPSESDNNTIIYDKNGLTHVFPWTYNGKFDSYGTLPPSVQRVRLEEFCNAEINEWG